MLASRLTLGLLVLAAAFVTAFVMYVVASRLWYPYELEWMEGAMVDHVCRVLEGELIYTAPTYEHVAFLYHPGYFYFAALMSLAAGEGFAALRLVSIVATLGSCLLIFRMVKRDGCAVGGLVGAAVFLAAFSLTGCYYDVGRIDPLFTCLLLFAIDRVRVAQSLAGYGLAVVAILLAWLTKQTAAVIAPFVVLGCLPRGLKPTVVFGGMVAAVCGLSVWILDVVHDGWMSYFTLELPKGHGILDEFYTAYWYHDMLPLLPAWGLCVAFVLSARERRVRVFHGVWIVGALIGSFLSRLHVGGAENVLIPVVAAVAVGAGLGASVLVARGGGFPVAAHLVGVVQLVVLFALPWLERPIPIIPSAETRAKADRHFAAIKAVDGPVFLPWHGYLARLAGKEPTAHSMALDDVWRSGNREVIEQMDASLRERLNRAPYPMVWVDDVNHAALRGHLLGAKYLPDATQQLEDLPPAVGSPLWPRVVLRR